MGPYAKEELLACVIARLLPGARHAAIGASSPIPATGCFLRRILDPAFRVSLQQRRAANPFSEGSRELFDLAGQGRIDTFFLGGAQIDGSGAINLVRADGRLEKAAGVALDAASSHVMLCGNPQMLKDAQASLAALGMRKHRRRNPGHITVESFW